MSTYGMSGVRGMRVRSWCVALLAVMLPRVASAQYIGVAIDQVTSTVDWQYPKSLSHCEFCVWDSFPERSRKAGGATITYAWRAQQWIGFTSELQLAPRGFAISQPTLEVSYLAAPQLLRVGKLIEPGLPIMPFVEGGFAPALRVRCRIVSNYNFDPCKDGPSPRDDDGVRMYDLTAITSLGVALRIWKPVITLRARRETGLLDVDGPSRNPTKHRATVISIGLLAPISDFRR